MKPRTGEGGRASRFFSMVIWRNWLGIADWRCLTRAWSEAIIRNKNLRAPVSEHQSVEAEGMPFLDKWVSCGQEPALQVLWLAG